MSEGKEGRKKREERGGSEGGKRCDEPVDDSREGGEGDESPEEGVGEFDWSFCGMRRRWRRKSYFLGFEY